MVKLRCKFTVATNFKYKKVLIFMSKSQLLLYWQELPWNEIKRKANKHLPKLVFVLLIVMLTQTLAELTWAFFTPAQTSVSKKVKHHVAQANSQASNKGLFEVGAYHLFGDAKKTVITQQKVIDAPETRLRLILKGIFASTNNNEALAIISSSKGQDKTYHIGEKVTGGATLHAVYTDRVILKRNGKLETLRLPKPKIDSKAFFSSSPDKAKSQLSATSTSNSLPASSQSQSQHLRSMRDTLLKDPSKVWQQVRINPVMKNGHVQGYTMMHNDKKIMKALNIKATDVVTSINGQSLSDPATLYGLMSSLSTQQTLELGIERNGQQQTIQLSF